MSLDPITAVLNVGGKLLDRLFPDPEQRAAAEAKMRELEQTGELARLAAETEIAKAQADVNRIEAGSEKLFKSGWRPWIGWVCGAAFAYHFVLQPFLVFALAAMGNQVTPPAFDMETLLTVLLGMLGLGGLRSFEKVRGVAR